MKKYLLLIMMLAFVGVRAENLDSLINASGWEDFGDFKAQKLKIGKITHRQISKDGKTLFTADANKYFRFWEIETGKLLKSFAINYYSVAYLLNDTVILFGEKSELSLLKISAFSLISESIYNLEPFCINYYIGNYITSYIYNENGKFQSLNDSILVVKDESFEMNGNRTYYFTRAKLINLNTKKEVTFNNFDGKWNNFIYIDSSFYVYDFFTTKYQGQEFRINIFKNGKGFYYYTSYDDYYTTIRGISIEPSGKYVYNWEKDKLFVFDSDSIKYVKTFNMPEVMVSLKGLDNKYLVGLNESGTKLYAFNWENNIYPSKELGKNKCFTTTELINNSKEILLTSMQGDIEIHNLNSINSSKVSFIIQDSNRIMGKDLIFTNLSSNNFDSFLWDFGDGETSKEIQPTHFYKKEGKYFINLKGLKNEMHYLSYLDSIEIKPNYFPNFEIDKSFGEVPLKVKFKNYSDFEVDSLVWIIDNLDTLKNEDNFEFTFTKPKNYSIKMIIYKAGIEFTAQRIISAYQDFKSKIVTIIDKHNYIHSHYDQTFHMERNFLQDFFISSENKVVYPSFIITEGNREKTLYNYYINRILNGKGYISNLTDKAIYNLNYFIGPNSSVFVKNIDSYEVYNKDFNRDYSINYPSSYNLKTFSKNIIIAWNSEEIRFADKYLKEFKIYSIEKITGDNTTEKLHFSQHANKFNDNQNIFMIANLQNNNTFCAEFDQSGNLINSFQIKNFYTNYFDIMDTNNLIFIDNKSKLKIFDSKGMLVYENNEDLFNNYKYWKDNQLIKVELNDKVKPNIIEITAKNVFGDTLINDNYPSTNYGDYPYSNYGFTMNWLLNYDKSIYVALTVALNPSYYISLFEYPENIISEVKLHDALPLLSPNPASDFININQAGIKNLRIYDLNGIELDCNAEYFDNMVRVYTFELQTGIYFVRYEINGKIYFEKFVKI